jgi:hypothetical protein
MQVLRLLRAAGVALAAAASLSSATIQADTANNATSVNTATVADILSVAGNVTDLPGGNSLCGASRVRQPWGALTADDQALYLEAVGIAVKNGALKQFADLYADEASGAQAEFSSAFFLWHRRLVLGFESYLRDLAPKFACLTVPYYDVHTAYVQSATKQCGSLYECSSIFKAFGGQASTKETSLVYNGVNVTGYLHTAYPFTSDCDDSNTCGSYVRNDLTKRVVPPSAGFSTFQSLIASTSDYASFLEGIQFGLHNEVRDTIGGALTTFASPRDVFFYSWHAALDMYLHTYQLCRIGVPMTEADFKASQLVFTNASESTGGISGIGANSKLLFNVKVNGTTVDISEHPTFGKYFSYVGNEAWNYGDLQQLGDYSYTYELPEVLRQQLLTNADVCTGFNRAFAATSDVSKTLTSTNITTKSTNITTTKTVTTTVIRNGTKYTTTTVTKTTVRRNTTTTTKSSLTSWLYNLTARFGYMYDLSDDSTYVEGYNVTNGYTGYNAYSANGILTTKHQGIIVADTTTKTNTIKGESIYGNVTTVRANVTLNNVTTVRDVTASVATSGEYWVWFRTVYEGLKTRFEGNMDLVAQHLQLLEYNTYTSVYGNIANFSNSFVTNYHLTSKRSIAGQIVDDIKAGKYEIAASTANFTSNSVRFVNTTVINRLITTYKRIVTRKNVTYLTTTYIKSAESAVKNATTLLIKSETSKKNVTSTGSSNSTTTVVTGGVSITSNKTTTVSGGGQDTTTTTTTTTAVTPAPATTTTTTTSTPAPSTTSTTGTATPAPATTTTTTTGTPAPSTTSTTGTATPASSTVTSPSATPAASAVKPAATPASSVPAATPAASAVKPAATPAASVPAATPAASTVKPAATPAASVPAATPAASTVKPAATPAASVPAATPAASTVKPAATPAASTPNIIKVVVTPAPTSVKLVC